MHSRFGFVNQVQRHNDIEVLLKSPLNLFLIFFSPYSIMWKLKKYFMKAQRADLLYSQLIVRHCYHLFRLKYPKVNIINHFTTKFCLFWQLRNHDKLYHCQNSTYIKKWNFKYQLVYFLQKFFSVTLYFALLGLEWIWKQSNWVLY